jgi:hypothetical protein
MIKDISDKTTTQEVHQSAELWPWFLLRAASCIRRLVVRVRVYHLFASIFVHAFASSSRRQRSTLLHTLVVHNVVLVDDP